VLSLLRSLWLHIQAISVHDEEGQGIVEYAFIVVLVSIVALLLVLLLGKQTNNLYSNVASAVSS
jgi:Flp pilus assembly pilin Flp